METLKTSMLIVLGIVLLVFVTDIAWVSFTGLIQIFHNVGSISTQVASVGSVQSLQSTSNCVTSASGGISIFRLPTDVIGDVNQMNTAGFIPPAAPYVHIR